MIRKSILSRQLLLWLLLLPVLACGPAARWEVTPTPTKTPTPLKPLAEVLTSTPSPTALVVPTPTPIPPTATPLPPPTATPVPVEEAQAEASADGSAEGTTGESADEAAAQADTEAASEPTATNPPPPTNTPAPPPPPTNTPAPPPPTNTPAPPPPPANPGPTVIIEMPNGDTYGVGDEVELIITVRDADGVGTFSWGVFTENKTGLTGDDVECNNATECRIEEKFNTQLPGSFQIGVEAIDAKGQGVIEIKQLYVG